MGFVPILGVGAVDSVNRNAETLGNKADDAVSGNGSTAFGEFDHTGFDILHNHAIDTMTVGLGGGVRFDSLERRLLFAVLQLQRSVNVVTDTSNRLHSGQAAVADGGIHILPGVEGQLL